MRKNHVVMLLIIIVLMLSSCGKTAEEKYCYSCGEKIQQEELLCSICEEKKLTQDQAEKSESIQTESGEHILEEQLDSETTDLCLVGNCEKEKERGRSYCSEHACASMACPSQKAYGSDYCLIHKCMDPICKNGKNLTGSYCSEHECASFGCALQKMVTSDYCIIHQ